MRGRWKIKEPSAGSDQMQIERMGLSDGADKQVDARLDAGVMYVGGYRWLGESVQDVCGQVQRQGVDETKHEYCVRYNKSDSLKCSFNSSSKSGSRSRWSYSRYLPWYGVLCTYPKKTKHRPIGGATTLARR